MDAATAPRGEALKSRGFSRHSIVHVAELHERKILARKNLTDDDRSAKGRGTMDAETE